MGTTMSSSLRERRQRFKQLEENPELLESLVNSGQDLGLKASGEQRTGHSGGPARLHAVLGLCICPGDPAMPMMSAAMLVVPTLCFAFCVYGTAVVPEGTVERLLLLLLAAVLAMLTCCCTDPGVVPREPREGAAKPEMLASTTGGAPL